MSSITDLASSIGKLGLSSTATPRYGTHLLNLQFPAYDLLPEKVNSPLLVAPTLLEQRARPLADPLTNGVHDTSFFAMIPVQPRNVFETVLEPNSAAGLVAAIEAASNFPAPSTLQMVSYHDPDSSSIMHRFRLYTSIRAGQGQQTEFQLDDGEWQKLLQQENQIGWLRLLGHLRRRISARAYYHVRDQLVRAYGEQGATWEEAAWSDSWNTTPPKSVKEILYARLAPSNDSQVSGTFIGPQRLLLVHPACGHQRMLQSSALVGLSAEACLQYECPECQTRLLQPADCTELAMRNEYLRAKGFLELQEQWNGLQEEIDEDNARRVAIPGSAVLCALSAALSSLRSPSLICPPELRFHSFSETKSVFEVFVKTLERPGFMTDCTVGDLYDSLLDLANDVFMSAPDGSVTAQKVLPPGWVADLRRWLTRAVRVLIDRGCGHAGPKHAGVHQHGNKLYCGTRDAGDYELAMEETTSDENEDRVTSMQELAVLLESSALEEEEL